MKASSDFFAVLGLAPTLDAAAVKRAYFAALARHPPHQDAEGFQRVRAAYEALSSSGGLAAAYLASSMNVRKLADEARERFDAAMQRASEAALAVRVEEETLTQFMERSSRMRWDEALRACADVGDKAPPA
ncbi:MAG TPA: J domain-containing protein [Hyalangium sp.]|nr:J domain-containing protein [Hyalangium sp.]